MTSKSSVDQFMIEEYKSCYEHVRNYQSSYTRLEAAVFSGAALAYGFLFSKGEIVSKYAWAVVPVLIGLSAIRCFGYYYALNFRYARYLKNIERYFLGDALDGFGIHGIQNFVSDCDRCKNIIFNFLAWVVLFSGSSAISILHILGKL